MDGRIKVLREFAHKLSILEKEFNLKILSTNGHTNASVLDLENNYGTSVD